MIPHHLAITYQKALQNAPQLGNFLDQVGRRTGARVISGLKNPQTTLKKVQLKNEEDPGRKYTLNDVNDVARGRLVYSSPQGVKQGVEMIKALATSEGLKVSNEDNYFAKPEDGYMGYHIDLKFPNGQTSEIQLHTSQSYAATLATHPVHEQYGDEVPPEAQAQKQQLVNQIYGMSPQQADQISAPIEQQVMPQQMQNLQEAVQTAQEPPPNDDWDTAVDVYKQSQGSIDDIEAARKTIMAQAQESLNSKELRSAKGSVDRIINLVQKKLASEERNKGNPSAPTGSPSPETQGPWARQSSSKVDYTP